MVKPHPKVAALPVMVLALAAVQLGSAFLAIAVQQSTGARLDRFLDGLVVLTVLWALVVLYDLMAFPSEQTADIVAGQALAITGIVAVLITIYRIAEALMGHSDGLRYVLGQFGYTSALVWAGASLGLLVNHRYRSAATTPSPTSAQPTHVDIIEPTTPPVTRNGVSMPTSPPVRQSAFSAAVQEPDFR